MRPARRLALLLLAGSAWLGAASADELVAQAVEAIPPEERGPGSPARARAIAGLLAAEGPASALAAPLRVALAEAWIEAGDAVAAAAAAAAVAGDGAADPALRRRAALAWIAAWGLRAAADAAVEDPVEAVMAFHLGDGRAVAAAAVAQGRRLLGADQAAAACAAFDRALGLLAGEGADQRVPVYALRLLAMEAGGAEGAAAAAWLASRADDPAVALLAPPGAGGDALGGEAPALAAPRLDGGAEQVDLAAMRGRPLLIEFFATWCRPCAELAPALAAAARRLHLQVVGVSLDTADTLAALPAYRAAHGITWPIIGEGLGWDGELDDAYGVGAIPALVLVDGDGRIAATDLAGASPSETVANLERALAALAPPPPAPRAEPAGRRELLP